MPIGDTILQSVQDPSLYAGWVVYRETHRPGDLISCFETDPINILRQLIWVAADDLQSRFAICFKDLDG